MALHDLVQYITTSPTLALLYGLAVFLPIYAVVHTFVIRPLPANAPQEIRDNYPISGAWGFWMRRWDWYRQRISQSQTGHFSFHVGSHPVVALSGDSGRQLNFESKDLGFAAGYAVLFGQTPAVDKYDDGHGRDHDVDNQFNRRLISLLKTEHFRRKLPTLISDTQEEVRNTAAKYARDPNAPLRYQLNDVPLDAWEAEFPIIDMCLRDSIRLNLLGTTFRKNTSGRAIPIGDSKEVIPPDAFVVYAAGDIHLNPEVYPNPYEWDPARYTPERAEDKRKLHGFLGWGAGRHPCLGMRFAKLEQNIITAYFIASFDFHLCDKSGNLVLDAPRVDFNRHSAHKPKNPPYLKVTPKEK
ncbi:conserved hypothetical protein [Pyrenophora tritici-repentis Pt-1C-BFP]|uniref:CypX, Cytochrome P450 n=1 Tax=Pyrenophora tritici-repentis (strain Pt-1C-BFP) TaxID=426418 RepID=B2VY05_PYRTR|nr:uncharacterized protein PTRG_03393 [Pyrenophora tritici-repentis Pt-1C-BFP]EDU45916.1 conserved hypothetical protein [Pyrenophora tritici-repentis Pt-1C-BFP]